MRIKFKKGITPERIAEHLVNIIRDEGLVIGAVNVYIQTYDENMKAVKDPWDGDYLCVQPSDYSKQEYAEDIALLRRKRFKAV